ncbi:Uncharacterized protein HZ326_7377 [Fusarium oxysporum f. sp. albedinis]|nr:Uncharacterized protein HZ326_7377 [Fusarium oxysporum f. sp. albedinis]
MASFFLSFQVETKTKMLPMMTSCKNMKAKPNHNKISRFGQALTIIVCCDRRCLNMNKHVCYKRDASSSSLFIFYHPSRQ